MLIVGSVRFAWPRFFQVVNILLEAQWPRNEHLGQELKALMGGLVGPIWGPLGPIWGLLVCWGLARELLSTP